MRYVNDITILAVVLVVMWKVLPIHLAPFHIWKTMVKNRNFPGPRVGIFKNPPGMMPGRWGFYFYGFEFGSRNSRDKFGVWLKNHGLWPW